jgi:hypothetical protein
LRALVVTFSNNNALMGPGLRRDDDCFAAGGTFPTLKSYNFPHIEIIRISTPNVSSRPL